MIDLTYSREKMLADIQATRAAAANCIVDTEDTRFVSDDQVTLIVERQTPAELLPILNAAFERRYAAVPSEQLFRDLLYPLKKGVGNAYKRGNRRQDSKKISVETIATRSGAVIAIADEGDGFDYANILERFEKNERYFTYRGSGFAQYQKARSVINFANGGRTLLIRFLCRQEPGRPLTSAARTSFGRAGDMAFMQSFLARELAAMHPPGTRLESCRASVPNNTKTAQWHIAFVLTYRNGRTNNSQEMVLTARVMPAAEAQTEFSATSQLSQLTCADLHIPQPAAYLEDPPMALFAFPPAPSLRSYMREVASIDEVVERQIQIASGLKAVHQSTLQLDRQLAVSDLVSQQQSINQRITQTLAQSYPDRANRVDQFCHALAQLATNLSAYAPAPIHAAFGWDSMLHHNGRLYVHFFEQSCYGHPAVDVGGYLADLARFYLLRKKADQTHYQTARDTFLKTYFDNRPAPWIDDLPFFTGNTMLLRLERLLKRPQSKWEPKIDKLLGLCEQVLDIN